MGAFSIWHILLLIAIAVLLFGGRGKISDLMGDVAKGVKEFRKGLNEPDEPKVISGTPQSSPSPANKDEIKVG